MHRAERNGARREETITAESGHPGEINTTGFPQEREAPGARGAESPPDRMTPDRLAVQAFDAREYGYWASSAIAPSACSRSSSSVK